MSSSIDSNISAFLSSIGVALSVTYARFTVREGDWKCDEWRFTIAREDRKQAEMTGPYFTGLGHRKQVKPMPRPPYNPRSIAYEQWEREAFKPKAPEAAGILSSLLLDGEAVAMSFVDWCDNYGYDSDSIEARNTYDECCAIGQKMRKLFSSAELESLREMLQDY